MFGRSESVGTDFIEYKESIDYLKTCITGLDAISDDEFTKILESISIHHLVVNKLNSLIVNDIVERKLK